MRPATTSPPAGFLGQTGGDGSYLGSAEGFFDRRAPMLWFRLHTG
jgi:hypothetical protein